MSYRKKWYKQGRLDLLMELFSDSSITQFDVMNELPNLVEVNDFPKYMLIEYMNESALDILLNYMDDFSDDIRKEIIPEVVKQIEYLVMPNPEIVTGKGYHEDLLRKWEVYLKRKIF